MASASGKADGKGRARLRWYYLVLPLLVVGLIPTLLRLADTPRAVKLVGEEWHADEGAYAGSEACRACHAAIVESQHAGSHAHTLRDLSRVEPVAPFNTGQQVVDPLTGARYEAGRDGNRAVLKVSQGQLRASEPMAYEFGSRNLATGYLIRLGDHDWVDARLNYYSKLGLWDFTSSQDKPNAYLQQQPLGRPSGSREASRCFACHTTLLRAHGVGKQPLDGSQLKLRPEKSILGITCEACHGPRAEHATLRKSGMPVDRPGKMSADEINVLCGRCHGLDNISPSHPIIERFQPLRLSQSRCFRAASGRLSCNTCHDPHADAVREPAYYEAICKSCHGGPQSSSPPTLCPVNSKDRCVSCHMPAEPGAMKHIVFVDHRIRLPEKRQVAEGR